jgi:hypothetical protein
MQAEYNTKLKEFSGEIEAERRVQTNIHSRLAARETDILETSVNMQRLQRELEDCKVSKCLVVFSLLFTLLFAHASAGHVPSDWL